MYRLIHLKRPEEDAQSLANELIKTLEEDKMKSDNTISMLDVVKKHLVGLVTGTIEFMS